MIKILTASVLMVAAITELFAGKDLIEYKASEGGKALGGTTFSNEGREGSRAFQVKGDAGIESTERFEVDPDKYYVISVWIKTVGGEPGRALIGFVPLDEDEKYIDAHYFHHTTGSLTKLTDAAKKGDISIKVKDASRWHGKGNFVAAFHAKEDTSDLPNRDVSSEIKSIEQKNGTWEIVFAKPLTKDYPAETRVREHAKGGYLYCKDGMAPTAWTKWTGVKMKGSELRKGSQSKITLLTRGGGKTFLFDEFKVEESN